MRETVILTGMEQQRLVVLNRVLMGDLTAADAATALERSVRQVRRKLATYRKEGAAALAHGHRGRTPAHALDPALRQRVIALARTTDAGGTDTHLTELLAAEEGIQGGRSSVRRLRLGAGRERPRRRRPPAHRRRRERKPQAGMLLQLDARPHAWLEDRRSWLHLIAAIDDATGTVPAAVFRGQEDAAGYLALLDQVITTVGVPEVVSHDRHGIFVRSSQGKERLEEPLTGAREPTQVGRALRELGIAAIAAHSPQAKGRVERHFGTLQDRLVVELGRAGATTVEAANAVLATYLPRFNARFAVPPTVAARPGGPSGRRPLPGRSAACAICAPWAAMTRCVSVNTGCNCCRRGDTAPTPAAGSRSASTSMAASRSGITGAAGHPGRPA